MTTYKRTNINDKYFILEVFECPTEIILFAANLATEKVTVENYTHFGKRSPIILSISIDNKIITPKLKQYTIDFEMTKSDFLNLKEIWHFNGCYAVFHEGELKFKASDLNNIARYKALDNFKWTLELAIPGSASSGWGQIVSPDKNLIDKVERQIIEL